MSSATLDRPVSATASSAAASLLAVRALRKRYRSGDKLLEVLRGVDFDLAPGEFVSVIGQSGSGKSTLLHLMGLLDGADSGSVHLAGRRVDDLPGRGLESLRVRLDLLGPGSVQIDGVRVFDLAFDESQRVQLSRRLATMDERLAAGDTGACLVELEGYWPRFLAAHVSDEAVAAVREAVAGQEGSAPPAPAATPVRSGGVLDRVRRWWQ
jgi:energy-coupling factor transporter ATP-binding protein EcfA2